MFVMQILSASPAVAVPPDSDDPIVSAVAAFAHAATTRDTTALRSALDPAAIQHVRVGGAWSSMPTEAYLTLMREGKIGGEPVQLEVHGVLRRGVVATVQATRTTPSYTFEDVFTLIEADTGWVIVGAAIVASRSAQ